MKTVDKETLIRAVQLTPPDCEDIDTPLAECGMQFIEVTMEALNESGIPVIPEALALTAFDCAFWLGCAYQQLLLAKLAGGKVN